MKRRHKHHIGSHTNHSHPDEQMNSRGIERTSLQNRTQKKLAAKKRRQRDKQEGP